MKTRTERLVAAPAVGPPEQRVTVRPTLDDVWAAMAIVVPALFVLASPLRTTDLAYHLRLGADIVATRSIPTTDTFTATAAGVAWVDQQWLAQVIMSRVHALAGLEGLIVMRALLVGAIMASVFAIARSRHVDPRTSSLVTIGAFALALPYLALRPQLLGALCFALTLLIVTRRASQSRLVWTVPLLTIAWANVHGSFVLAPILVAAALAVDTVGRRPELRRTAAVLVATVAATLVNPWGLGVWRYVVELSTNETIRSTVTEWVPPSFATTAGAMFLLTLVGIAAWFGARRAAVPSSALVLVAAASVVALMASRNVLWWSLAVPPLLAGAVVEDEGAAIRGPRGGSTAMNRLVLVALTAAVVVVMPWWRPADDLVSGLPSPGMLAEVERVAPRGARFFVHQPWASWLELRRPDLRPFVDSRIELFDRATWDAYDGVIVGRADWRATLERFGIDAILVRPTSTTLVAGLDDDPRWTRVAADDTAVLFVES